ncbi:MAG: hypothetical protein WCO03_00505, partial [bacterium]
MRLQIDLSQQISSFNKSSFNKLKPKEVVGMKVKHLRKGIIYEGSGIIGGNSKVILTPTDNPGWLWDTGGNTVPISPEMVRPKFRHISLESGDSGTIGYIEHLLPIRYFGIDEVML